MHLFRKSRYNINGFEIKIPKKHMLPIFQKKFPLYDKFLPFLVNNYKKTGSIIDVGANCGDTLFSIYTPNNHYICIEGSSFFYDYLVKNINKFQLKNVETICALVGNDIEKSGVLSEGNSTKHVVKYDGINAIKYQKLDNLCSTIQDLIILKSDVDGFDYDTIISGLDLIKKFKPIIYFEAQFNIKNDVCHFLDLIKLLYDQDFIYITLFDNFGEVLYNGDVNFVLLEQFFNYVSHQNFGKASRTIYYFDILMCDSIRKYEVVSIIENYINSYQS